MSRWRHHAQWIMATRPVQWFLQRVLPKIRFSTQPPRMTSEQFRRFMNVVQPGDIVFSKDRSKLSNLMIGGFWAHVGVVDLTGEIIEAHYPKVRRIHPAEFCFTSDLVGIVRPGDALLRKSIAENSPKFIGMPYDTLFVDGRESLYCSELVWTLDPFNKLGFDTTDEVGLGIGYVSPDDIFKAVDVEFAMIFQEAGTVSSTSGKFIDAAK